MIIRDIICTDCKSAPAGAAVGANATTKIGKAFYRFNKYAVPFIKAKFDWSFNDGLSVKSDADALANYATSFIANRAISKATEKFPEVFQKDGLLTALKKSVKPAVTELLYNATWNASYNPIFDKHIKPNLPEDPILIIPPTNPIHE